MANRLTTALATVLLLGGAGAACWLGAGAAAGFIESRSRQDVSLALRTGGLDWASVSTDGLRVYLGGDAPTEAARFRAMTAASAAVDASRIIDRMTVATAETLNPPDFEIELLRNDDGIQLIGLVPAATDRLALVRLLRDETAAPQVTDLLETADYPVPANWQPALDFGLRAAQASARSKVSISAGAVTVTAITDSPAEKARLEGELTRLRPRAVTLATEISAPRPVIAPFTLRFVKDDAGARFDACAADSAAARARILEAAKAAGLAGPADCTLGLGVPSPDWASAAVAAIGAVGALGSGTVTLSDADVALVAPASITDDRFDEAVGRLEAALPAVFSLQSRRETASDAEGAEPAEFSATIAPDGTIALRGRITDERMRDAVDSFARARFKGVDSSLRTDAGVPAGWTVRVIAGLQALAGLHIGAVTVTPDVIRITGTSGDSRASTSVAASLSERLGAGARYELAVRYDKRLDPALGLPDGEECVDRLNIIMAESAIGFEPNKSAIAGNPGPTLEALRAVMADCADFQIEIGGHTDSQGSEAFNADLSRARAQAILTALGAAGAPVGNITARGYGESQPVASNDTDAGREANRRIEFRLLSELPVRSGPLPAPQLLSGVTGAPPAAPSPIPPAPIAASDLPADAAPPAAAVAPAAPRGFGPPVPGTVPAVVGVPERARGGFSADEGTARVPVQSPDPDTPRPLPRPGAGADAGTGPDAGGGGGGSTGGDDSGMAGQ